MMSTTLKTIVILSNYSHDIATAFLFISAVGLYLLSKTMSLIEGPEDRESFLVLFRRFTLMARVSLVWVLLAGVPRVVFYKQLEWSQMAGQMQVVAIIIKHIFMFLLVGTGILHWRRLSKKAKEIEGA
jgi:uncharacterized membrane protein